MKEYIVVLEFRVAIVDVNKEAEKARDKIVRQAAKEIFDRRLAGIKATQQTKKGSS